MREMADWHELSRPWRVGTGAGAARSLVVSGGAGQSFLINSTCMESKIGGPVIIEDRELAGGFEGLLVLTAVERDFDEGSRIRILRADDIMRGGGPGRGCGVEPSGLSLERCFWDK